MAWQSGGGGGLPPGVTGDGSNGLIIAGSLVAGDQHAAVTPSQHHLWGQTTLEDTPANMANNWAVLVVAQNVPVDVNGGSYAIDVLRQGVLGGNDYVLPMVALEEAVSSAQPSLQVTRHNVSVLNLTTLGSITGALSTVADAPAKAVLTSMIAALTGIDVAANNTT